MWNQGQDRCGIRDPRSYVSKGLVKFHLGHYT